MSSKKEEERNEKIIRGLLKLPPNRRCINCNSLGPQYVCTNFWTFICIACSGVHREFTHRVKSVSMAKFQKEEVDALQRGGNQRARELYLKDYDPMQLKFPDSRNVEKIREFIKSVYVDKKYAGERNPERPPRDLQNNKTNTEEHRRASSYHSYSQSPPYDFQYEDRINGKKQQNGFLSRKPGSDKGNYEGKLASFLSLPINQQEQICHERIGNQSPGFRVPNGNQSPGFGIPNGNQSPGFGIPNGNQSPGFGIRDVEDSNGNGSLRSNRTTSFGSVGSFDSVSLKSADSNNDNFDESIMQNPANNTETNKDSISENIGWATFDSSPVKTVSQANDFDSKKEYAPLTELFPADFSNPNLSSNENTNISETWSAFEDLNGNATQELSAASDICQNWFSFEDTKSTQLHTLTETDASLNINNPFACDEISEICSEDWVQKLSINNDFATSVNPFDSLTLTESNHSTEANISINPFDLPLDAHSESLNMFMDIGPMGKGFPDFEISDAFSDNLFPPQSVQPNLTGQAPNPPFMNMVAPTAVTSGSGNPFA